MICPCKLPAVVWMDDPTQWPPLSYPDLHHYLIETAGIYTQEKMENYKVLQVFLSGWVQNVVHVILLSENVCWCVMSVLHTILYPYIIPVQLHSTIIYALLYPLAIKKI